MSMKTAVLRWAAFACCVGVWHSASATQPYQDYRKHMESAQTITALTDELMGDSVSLYSGATEFTATDIDLPGNNALPVQLRRRFSIEIVPSGSGNPGDPNYRGAGNWDVDVPYISTTWTQGAWESTRCSSGLQPNVPAPLDLTDVWQGNTVHVPGAGDRKLLKLVWTEIPRPSVGGPYKWSTRERDVFSCIPMQNEPGAEGFLMKTASGLHYYFDRVTTRSAGTMTYQPGVDFLPQSLGRTRVYLLASKIVDRFGNTVTFTYNTAGHPTRIESSDDRVIVLTYDANGRLDNATANGRTWQYTYWAGTPAMLKTVQLPGTNGGTWQYAHTGTLFPDDGGVWETGSNASCSNKPPEVPASFGITITHPSGAIGAFQFSNQRHPRSGVHKNACQHRTGQGSGSGGSTPYYKLYTPNYFDVMSLDQKTITGPGLVARTWTYDYQRTGVALWGTWGQSFTYPCTNTTACPVDKTVTVNEPDGTKKQYRYGYLYAANEGRLLGTTTLDANDVVRRTETTDYLPEPPGQQNFYPLYGQGFGPDDPSTLAVRPVIAHTIAQDGVTFTMQVKTGCGGAGRYCFDLYGHPTQATKSSSLGDSRDELTEYHGNTSLWILGQVSKTTIAGIVASETGYDTLAMPTWSKAFGKLQHTLAYETAAGTQEGTLKTVTDGRNYVTTLSNWHRGIPGLIQHPATPDQPSGTTQSAVVDNNGWITSVTDENGYTTVYDYDDMGRLTLIDYPDGDTVNWNSTTISFTPGHQLAYGMPAGHWRQIIHTGNARKTLVLDALWRPVVEQTLDLGDVDDTLSEVVKRYDSSGRLAFQSYPLRGLDVYTNPALKGTRTEYDALDRVTAVRQNAENGTVLSTTTAYLTGFKTRTTSPKHQGANPAVYTETTYQAWDQPTTEFPETIAQPEGALTTIGRDTFGKPTAITRSGGGASATRSYAYNVNHELCRSVEPETGATLYGYDGAGNLTWSAAGLAGTPACGTGVTAPAAAESRAIYRSYDARNRLLDLLFPDGRGDQFWAYTPDGLPLHVHTVNVVGANNIDNAWEYNHRRLLKTETQLLPAWYFYSLTYEYDGNGSLGKLWYPTGQSVEFAPNALGQAKHVRGGTGHMYASAVTYHPSGSIAGFIYGNGVAYSMTPNTRQLPARATHGVGVTDFSYGYDGNGNVTSMTDHVNGNQSRTMTYDGLDRLKTVTSYMFGSPGANYDYNALDNLTRVRVGGPNSRDHFYCYDAANRLTNLKNISCSGSTVTGLGYDLQGNVTNKDGELYDFDYGNRLREVMGVERYRYDAHGRRMLATNLTTGTIYSFYGQAGQLLYQKNTRTGQEKEIDHIYLAGSLIAQREQAIGGGTATVKYHHTDALGSPTEVTSQAGGVLERTEYEPFGEQLVAAASIGSDGPGYTGHVRDVATGLVQMQQRYYDPGIGRFLSVDPIAANSGTGANFNRYWYANNNPYRFTDPDGRQSWSNTGTANPWPAVQQACGGSNSCEQGVAGDLATAEAGIVGGAALLAIPDPSDLVVGAAIGRLALGLRASSSFPRAKRYIESIADGLGPTGGRSGRRTAEFDGQGGESGAAKLFNRLTRGESTPRDGGRLGSLGDGSRVQTSTRTMKDGTRETSVRISSERTGSRIKDVVKVRFREKPE